MEWEFANKHLANLYTKGFSRKFKFMDKRLAEKFVERVERISAAVSVNDLRYPPSMNFEKLQGYDNRFSIRLDGKHRVEFEIAFEDEGKTVGSILIVTVSKHYQ